MSCDFLLVASLYVVKEEIRPYTIQLLLFRYELPQCFGDKLEIFPKFSSNRVVCDSVSNFL